MLAEEPDLWQRGHVLGVPADLTREPVSFLCLRGGGAQGTDTRVA